MLSCFRAQIQQSHSQPIQANASAQAVVENQPIGELNGHEIQMTEPFSMPVANTNLYSKKKYKEMGMLASYRDSDQESRIPYLDQQQRARYQVTIHDGLIYKANGQPLDTMDGKNPAHRYLFVMDNHGRIFSGSKQEVRHHSVFLAGYPVAAAGHLEVVQGKIKEVDNQSGHYAPPRDFTKQIVKEMKSRKADLTEMKIETIGNTKKFYKSKKIEVNRLYPGASSAAGNPLTTKIKKY